MDGVSHDDILIQDHVLASQNTSITAHILSRVHLSDTELTAALRMLNTPQRAENALTHHEGALTADRERAFQQQVLGTDSLQSLLDALSEIDNRSVSKNRQMNVYLKLKALIYLTPKLLAPLGSAS